MDDLKERVIKNEVKLEMLEKNFIKLETDIKTDINKILTKLEKIEEDNQKQKELNATQKGTLFGISKSIVVMAGLGGGAITIIKIVIDLLK